MRLHVLVRTDLPCSSPAVQAGHAVAEFMLRHPGRWPNETLVYLAVPNENELAVWGDLMRLKGCEVVEFYEPDADGRLTAIAVEGAGSSLRKLPLLKEGK